jgi:hypothetical protein
MVIVPRSGSPVLGQREVNSGMTISAGTYVYQIKAGKFIQSKKMTLLR